MKFLDKNGLNHLWTKIKANFGTAIVNNSDYKTEIDKAIKEDEIKKIQFEAFIKIKELYVFNTQSIYKNLLEQLKIIDDGIVNTDLSKATIKDLFTIKNDILMQVDKIENKIKTNARVTVTNDLGYKENLDLKLNEI